MDTDTLQEIHDELDGLLEQMQRLTFQVSVLAQQVRLRIKDREAVEAFVTEDTPLEQH